MLPLGRRRVSGTAIFAVTAYLLLSPGCATPPSAHSELASAVALGREALGLQIRAARFCEPAAEAPMLAGECHVTALRGPAGASFYEGEHAIAFRFTSADGAFDLGYRSEREGGVREIEVEGRVTIDGRPYQIGVSVLAVARAGAAYEESEVAIRARVDGADRHLDLDEVQYRIRENGNESFYRTYYDVWDTPGGTFTLEDGLFEGARDAGGRWRLSAEGAATRDGAPFADVELGGPYDAQRAILATSDGQITL